MITNMMRPRIRVLEVLRVVANNYGRVIESTTDGISCLNGDLELHVGRQTLGTTKRPHSLVVFDPPAAIQFFVVLEPGRQTMVEMATILADELEVASWALQQQDAEQA